MDPFCVFVIIAGVVGAGVYFAKTAGQAPAADVPLDARVRAAFSSAFTADVVGPKVHASGLRGVAKQQQALLAALQAGEELRLITPAMNHTTFQGLAVITDRRAIEFKNKVRSEVPIHQIVTTTLGTHPGGYVIVRAVGENFTEFSPGISNWQLDLNLKNHVQVDFPMLAVARHFVAVLDGLRGRSD